MDVPLHRWARLQFSLEANELRNLIMWDRAARSPASSSDAQRLAVRGYLPIGTSTLEANLFIMELRKFFDNDSCLVCRQELLWDKIALLKQFTSIHEVIFISAKRALVKTSTPAAAWHALLTQDICAASRRAV